MDRQYSGNTRGTPRADPEGPAGPAGPAGPPGPPGPDSGFALVWGATVIPNQVPPSYLRIGGPSAAAGTVIFEIAFPWAGIVDSLLVLQNLTSVNLLIPYTLYVNGVATALTVTHNANSLGPTSDLLNAVAVAANDRLALRALDNTLSTGTINLVATARFRRT